jgi:hypothetical protein
MDESGEREEQSQVRGVPEDDIPLGAPPDNEAPSAMSGWYSGAGTGAGVWGFRLRVKGEGSARG